MVECPEFPDMSDLLIHPEPDKPEQSDVTRVNSEFSLLLIPASG